MNDPGHNYRFGAPSKGWPSFCPDCGYRLNYCREQGCLCGLAWCTNGHRSKEND